MGLESLAAGEAELICPDCGYSLRGLREVHCPGCGWQSTLDDVVAHALSEAAEA